MTRLFVRHSFTAWTRYCGPPTHGAQVKMSAGADVYRSDLQYAAVAGLKEDGGTNTISSEDGEYHFSMEIDPNNVINCDYQQSNCI